MPGILLFDFDELIRTHLHPLSNSYNLAIRLFRVRMPDFYYALQKSFSSM
jgi:hypothetical protein